MQELRAQLDAGEARAPSSFDAIVHACGSGGTAAGVALGAARYGVAKRVIAMAVCDDRQYFEQVTERMIVEAAALLEQRVPCAELEIVDQWKGPAYAVPSDDQAHFIARVARACGLILDPVYTGKALYGLAQITPKPARVLFIHTGGLPGLLAQTSEIAPWITPSSS
jgi:D-cysteine desulfhydrase